MPFKKRVSPFSYHNSYLFSLVETVFIQYSCAMRARRKQGPRPRRTTATLRVREIEQTKGGVIYTAFRVEGYKDPTTGKRKQPQFKTEEKARAFIATAQVAMLNKGQLHAVTTRLTPEQVAEAEAAFNRLGNRGTLDAAVTLYLGKAALPEKTTPLRDAITAFLIGKEKAGLRPQSRRQLESTVSRFIAFAESKGLNAVHEIDAETVEAYLQTVRAKNGVDPATPKTRRNYRLDLSSFFNWCANKDRRWTLANPCEGIGDDTIVDEGGEPEVLTIRQAARMMRDAESFADGALVRYLALALFAGIRPGGNKEGELRKLADHPELIDLKKGTIEIPGNIAKTRKKRLINIRPNLRKWLEATEGKPVLPKNQSRLLKTFRKKHGLSHDELRHTFISFHVGAFRSIGEAALEAGNSEGTVKKHYLNIPTKEQGEAFWRIAPKAARLTKRDSAIVIPFKKSA